MSLRPFLAFATLLVLVNPVSAQRINESREPPLADDPNGSQTNAARDAIQLTSNTRVIDAAAPLVRATVQAPTMHAAGSPMPVKLIVENTARSPAQNVSVTYSLPAGAAIANPVPAATPIQDGSVWRLETLAAGARKEITFTVTTPVSATDFDHKVRIACEFEQTAKTRFAKPELKLRKTGPDQALKHDILVFGLDVTNSGAAELTDVQLVDVLPEGLEHRPDDPIARNQPTGLKPASEIAPDKKTRTFKIGKLPPGQSRRIDYYVMATGAGTVLHKAQAIAAGNSVTVNAETKVVIAEPKLELAVETPPRRAANLPARLQIKLTNRSLRSLANIVVTDRIDGGATAESVSSGGQSFPGLVQWIVPVLAPNETRVLEATVRCPTGGRVAHKVAAVYRGLSQSADGSTEFEALAALQWDFRASSFAVELNGEVTYTLTVRNVGSAPATNVRPAISIPAEMRIVKASPNAPTEGGRVQFDATTLPVNGRVVFAATAKAIQTVVEGRVVAEVAADVLTAGPIRKQEAITIGGNDAAVPTAPSPPSARPPKPAPPLRP